MIDKAIRKKRNIYWGLKDMCDDNDIKVIAEFYDLYVDMIAKEKEVLEKNVLIDTGKVPHENFRVDLLPGFPKEKAQVYGFTQKMVILICGLDLTNENLIQLYETWQMIHNNLIDIQFFNTYYIMKLVKLQEYIIHDIKHFIDQMIAIMWCLSQQQIVEAIEISSIGEYLNKQEQIGELSVFCDFFMLINDIENAYKHSVANDTGIIDGREEACFTALYSKHNKNYFNPEFYCVPVKEVVEKFNEFYRKIFQLLGNMG